MYRLQLGDAIGDFLKLMPGASVDLVITAPAWESLNQWREIGTTTRLGGHRDPDKRREDMWFPTFENSRVPEMMSELARVLKPGRHCYIFCDYTSLKEILKSDMGFWQYEKVLVWDKLAPGMGYHYRAQYEFVWFAVRAGAKETHVKERGISDVLRCKRPTVSKDSYPTEKPVDLCSIFVSQSSEMGELVIDPFFGSGAIGVAAVGLEREFAGCDILPAALELAERRLSEFNQPGRLEEVDKTEAQICT